MRAWPAFAATSSFKAAPTTNVLPSLLRDTEPPNISPAPSPSRSQPFCSHSIPDHSNTRTWPLASPSKFTFDLAPIASVLPSLLNDTADPDALESFSPSMSAPLCSHSVPVHTYTRTCPLPEPPPALLGEPIANSEPSLLSETADPELSPALSPMMLCPIWTHEELFNANTRTLPALELPASLLIAPTAKMLPSLLRDTDSPKKSPGFSPSISSPSWIHSDPV